MTEFEQQMAREKELSTDMWAVAHLITSPDWGDKDKHDELKRKLDSYGDKYGRDVLSELEQTIGEAVYQACERIQEGWEE
jgi:hypothetical protein